jgi:hypothetical protein
MSVLGFNIRYQICGWKSSVQNYLSYLKKKLLKVQTTKIFICVMKILSRAINFDRQGHSLTMESALT